MSIAGRTLARPRHADDEMFERVRAKLARFARDAVRQVRLARPLLPDELGDRAQDNWEPLLAIAQVAGEAWLQRATVAALTLSGASDATPSTGNELLADIQEVFERKQVSKISTADLIKALVADDERPWATYNRGHEISPRQVAKQLAAYGIKSKTVRLGAHNTPKGYESSQFADAFARYLGASCDGQKTPSNPGNSDCDGMDESSVEKIAAAASGTDSPPTVAAANKTNDDLLPAPATGTVRRRKDHVF